MIPMADRKPLPVSPNDVRLQIGLPPSPTAPSSHSMPDRHAPVWSLPGRWARLGSKPAVWQ